MKPINFEHCNKIFGANQANVTPLPALLIDSPQGEVITCWKLNLFERLIVLLTGKVWMANQTFNEPLQPITLTTDRRDVYTTFSDRDKWYTRLINYSLKREVK